MSDIDVKAVAKEWAESSTHLGCGDRDCPCHLLAAVSKAYLAECGRHQNTEKLATVATSEAFRVAEQVKIFRTGLERVSKPFVEKKPRAMLAFCQSTAEGALRAVDDGLGAGCRAGRQDGECSWKKCPQIADGEPVKTGRHCPLDVYRGDEE